MRPRIKVIALAVDDVEGSLGFYRDGMGLPTQAIFGTESEDGSVVFFEMNDNMVLALYPRTALARDANVSAPPHGPAQLSVVFVHNVGSKREVDAVMEQAERAGAEITDPPHDRFWGGYTGYFRGPDGHVWEIAWNPQWEVEG